MHKYPELNRFGSIWELEGEVWKDISSHEGKYQISNFGRVRRLPYTVESRNQNSSFLLNLEALVMKANNDSSEYPSVVLRNPRRTARVHRLVAEAFLPAPSDVLLEICKEEGFPYVLVNHKDKIKTNPNVNNLEWCSNSENLLYSKEEIKESYFKISGSNHVLSKLTEDDVTVIVNLLREGLLSQEKIADMFGVKQITISNIWTGRSWAHFTGIPWTARTRKRKPEYQKL